MGVGGPAGIPTQFSRFAGGRIRENASGPLALILAPRSLNLLGAFSIYDYPQDRLEMSSAYHGSTWVL